MQLFTVLKKDCLFLDKQVNDKLDLYTQMATILKEKGAIANTDLFLKALEDRDNQSPTAIGEGVAIPHGISDTVIKPTVVYFRLKNPISYDSLDGQPIKHIFMIAIPNELRSNQVKILSDISVLLLDDSFKHILDHTNSTTDIIEYMEKTICSDDKQHTHTSTDVNSKKIVAITSCTTGIAHTFMAEKALYNAAEKLHIKMNVETQGAGGVENKLTDEQIKQADVVILAIEKGIDESRFAGKDILKVSPGKAIKDGASVITDALDKKGTYQIDEKDVNHSTSTDNSQGNKTKSFYQHMLSGVSYMIPIVVAGGILIALSFSFGITAFENEGSLPWALFQIGSVSAFSLMFPVLAGFIAYDIADKPGFAPGIIAGFVASNTGSGFFGALVAGYLAGYLALLINKKMPFPKSIQGLKTIVFIPVVTTLLVGLFTIFVVGKPIAALQDVIMNFLSTLSSNNAGIVILSLVFSLLYFDLGGPISKMVYSFGLAALAENIYGPMGAIMVIGMVPPIGMAIATMLRPNLFDLEEREAGKTALVLGMSFITEGAIPFLIAKPKSSIPSFMIGGFVGSLTAFTLGLEITAPHGGLFLALIPNAVNNVFYFLISLLAGGFACALSMIILTTKFNKTSKLK